MRFHDAEDSEDTLSDINVTPLVDVMLVLLVIFIVTAPLLTNTIPVNLPKTEAVENNTPSSTTLSITINQQGTLSLNDRAIPLDQLQQRLREEVAQQQPQPQVQLQADQGVNYGIVAKVMAVIEQAGITRLSVITER